MKGICFLVNVDWFFHSHRRPLEKKLSSIFKTSIIAGNSGLKTEYPINKFQVNSRVPTIRGIFQLYRYVKRLDRDVILIVVSPVMIILCHFLFWHRKKIIYNFSGLGFLRSKSYSIRSLIIKIIKIFPVNGSRVFVVQNSDDFEYLYPFFYLKKNYHIKIIAGSGFENNNNDYKINASDFTKITIGYVGRIRKDKGVLDLLRAVHELQIQSYEINLVVWGELDKEGRHGFNKKELYELNKYKKYLKGFSHNKTEIYSSFNWFCLPSNGEGLSKAAIEACSFGLPLILSNVQGNRDMVKNNGYLFNYGDITSLKKILIGITELDIDDILCLSNNSRKMFNENWTLDVVYNEWMELLNSFEFNKS